MLTLDDLRRELSPADPASRLTQEAAWFMTSKGYSQVEPIGVLEVDGGCYFYYEIGRDHRHLIELEVVRVVDDALGRDYLCTVTLNREVC